jgi:hypothetical protein
LQKIKKQSNQRIKKKCHLGGVYMLPTISTTAHLCRFLEAEVQKAKEGGKMLTTEGLEKFVQDLTFSDKIEEENPLHEFKNTEDVQGRIKLLAEIYVKEKSKAKADVKAGALNALAEAVESKSTLAKIKRARTLLKIKGFPQALLKKLDELVQKLKTLAGKLSSALRAPFLKKVGTLEDAVKSEEPEAIEEALEETQKWVAQNAPTDATRNALLSTCRQVKEELTTVIEETTVASTGEKAKAIPAEELERPEEEKEPPAEKPKPEEKPQKLGERIRGWFKHK